MRKLFLNFAIVIIAIYNIGCDDTITVNDVDNRMIPDSNVSFAEHIYPVFQVKCASTGCHSGPNPRAGLDLTTWSGATADVTVIFPGYPDNSSLIWTIEGVASFPPMPPIGYSPLTINQINGIRTWIQEGAKNN